MTFRRTLSPLAIGAILVGTALAALGAPNFSLAWQYLSGGYPSQEAALALVAIICWVLIAVMVILSVVASVKAATEAQRTMTMWSRAIMVLTAGLVVLGLGVIRHGATGYSMDCGDCQQRIAEASQLASH